MHASCGNAARQAEMCMRFSNSEHWSSPDPQAYLWQTVLCMPSSQAHMASCRPYERVRQVCERGRAPHAPMNRLSWPLCPYGVTNSSTCCMPAFRWALSCKASAAMDPVAHICVLCWPVMGSLEHLKQELRYRLQCTNDLLHGSTTWWRSPWRAAQRAAAAGGTSSCSCLSARWSAAHLDEVARSSRNSASGGCSRGSSSWHLDQVAKPMYEVLGAEEAEAQILVEVLLFHQVV